MAVLACWLVPAMPQRLLAQESGSQAGAGELKAAEDFSPTIFPAANIPSSETPAVQTAHAPDTPAAKSASSGGLLAKFREDFSKPLTPKRKFERAIKQSLFPGILGSAGAAGLGMAENTRADRDYGMGGEGFLDRWGSAFGQNAVGAVVGDYAFASIMHQDPRYHPDTKRGFGRRLGYALKSVVVTQSDSGTNEFNASHLLGILVATGSATAWHHHSDRTAAIFGKRFGYDVASSAIYHVVEEFLFYKNEPRH
ncbi:MAG TPA: hypothetical protein VEG63_11015 [Candidatus Acidoferrales bacterium]|nr:hypothetical protein [Candidatus Acidoferrales bacterium]